jgi:hypothetical protein
MSPRIAWFSFLRFVGNSLKFACLLAVIGGIGWGVWLGIEKAFYQNPDFRLQVIDLNANPVIDESGLAQFAGINIAGSLFDVDIATVVAKLKTLPGIEDAQAERHLPGTLVVRVVARSPRAWISCPGNGIPGKRTAGGMLVDHAGIAYPCPDLQLEEAMHLPLIELPASEGAAIKAGQTVTQAELKHCFRLLDSAIAADPEAAQWIECIRQVNKWSLLLVTRDGTEATFGLGDHERQINRLRAAMDHANQKSYAIATINLIPQHNIPITLREEPVAPKASPVSEPTPDDIRQERRARDLNHLLNRN